MRKVGLFEAKQKLSELVRRAVGGERIAITRRGKVEVELVPVKKELDIHEIFADMEKIRQKSRKPKDVSTKDLIEEGRR
jgi:prevent-host-death family protein